MDKIFRALEKPICDHCLGRQIAQVLTGYSNDQRGEAIRNQVAIRLGIGEKMKLDMSNFSGFKFRNKDIKTKKQEKCYYCDDFFKDINKTV